MRQHVRSRLESSERRACAVVGQPRATQRRHLKTPDDEAALTAAIVRLATRYGRYGYRRIREMLVAEGWRVNVKRVYRIWRREGLKVPMKQPKRGRLWLNDGSCVRLRPRASKPRLVLRLRPGPHTGRTRLPHAGRARRVHAPMPGDRGGETAQIRRRAPVS